MSEIIRVKSNSKRRKSNRKKRVTPLSKRFEMRFPRVFRFFSSVNTYMNKHRFLQVLTILFAAGLIFSFIFTIAPLFALDFSHFFSAFLRTLLSAVTSVFPFSLAEIAIYLFALFLILVLVVLFFALKRKYTFHHIPRKMKKLLRAPILVLLLVLDIFLFSFFPAYQQPGVATLLSMPESEVYDAQLYDTFTYMVREINQDVRDIQFDENGASILPTSFSETALEINSIYLTVSESYPALHLNSGAPAKPLLSSPLLTSASLGGFYAFFTGEANVNTHCPDYVLPHTIAHECAHQRGFAKEMDAEFVAFLVSTQATDPYLRYSGHLNALLTMTAELRDTLATMSDTVLRDEVRDTVNEILETLDPRVQTELAQAAKFYAANQNSTLSEITEDINDSYLKAQGEESGVRSYQQLTALIVNFYTTYMA